MRSSARFLILFALIPLSCKESQTRSQKAPPTAEGPPTTPSKYDKAEILKIAKLDFNDPQVDIDKIRSYAREIQRGENVSYGQAVNEICLFVTNETSGSRTRWLTSWFSRAVLEDPGDVASILGQLPAGDLRRQCVASLNGGHVKPAAVLQEYYKAMPESADQRAIGRLLVKKSYSESGMDGAIAGLDALATRQERAEALSDFVNQLVAKSRREPSKVTSSDTEKLRNYAETAGIDKSNLEMLKLINASK